MISTLFLLGAGFLLGNEEARHKVEQSLKSALVHGLSNFQKDKVGNATQTTTERAADKPSNQPMPASVQPIIQE